MKGMRRHARGRFGMVEYKYMHYFVRLEEGPPPKKYFDKVAIYVQFSLILVFEISLSNTLFYFKSRNK